MSNNSMTIHELNSIISDSTVKADLVAVISFDVNECLIKEGRVSTEIISLYRSQSARRSRKPLLMMKNGDCPFLRLGLAPDEIYSLAVDALSANSLAVINTEKGCAVLSLGHLALNGFAIIVIPNKRFQQLLLKHFGRTERIYPLADVFMGVNKEIDAFFKLTSIALSVGIDENDLISSDYIRCSARALCELMDFRVRLRFIDESDKCGNLSAKLFSALLIIAAVTSCERGGIRIPDVEIVRYEDMYLARFCFRLSIKPKGTVDDLMSESNGIRAFNRIAKESGIMLRSCVRHITPKRVEVMLDTSLVLAHNVPTGVKRANYWDLCKISAILFSDRESQ